MISLYAIALPPIIGGLKNTVAFLTKAMDQASAKNIDLQTFLSARLHPTMADLPKQIHYITFSAKEIPVRLNPSLAALELPDTPDTTFPELLERLKKTIEYLESIKAESIDGREDEDVFVDRPGPGGATIQLKFTPVQYLCGLAQPNFWFHVTTAYGLLRREGVDLAKMDYLNGAQLVKMA
jgi:hypothetical protein